MGTTSKVAFLEVYCIAAAIGAATTQRADSYNIYKGLCFQDSLAAMTSHAAAAIGAATTQRADSGCLYSHTVTIGMGLNFIN